MALQLYTKWTHVHLSIAGGHAGVGKQEQLHNETELAFTQEATNQLAFTWEGTN